jgi:polysaccharide export outer membrane protein
MNMFRRYLITLLVVILGGCVMDERPSVVPYNQVHVYRLGSGDQIRVVVFDQPTLSTSYKIDASGNVSIPLAGTLRAEGKTTRQVENSISTALKDKGIMDDPKVSVEVAVYRPFSILGEVKAPGRFPFSPGMTIDDAVALAGGYTIHADQNAIRVTSRVNGKQLTNKRPPTATFRAGDALYVTERWY